jgi:hypothetical protein
MAGVCCTCCCAPTSRPGGARAGSSQRRLSRLWLRPAAKGGSSWLNSKKSTLLGFKVTNSTHTTRRRAPPQALGPDNWCLSKEGALPQCRCAHALCVCTHGPTCCEAVCVESLQFRSPSLFLASPLTTHTQALQVRGVRVTSARAQKGACLHMHGTVSTSSQARREGFGGMHAGAFTKTQPSAVMQALERARGCKAAKGLQRLAHHAAAVRRAQARTQAKTRYPQQVVHNHSAQARAQTHKTPAGETANAVNSYPPPRLAHPLRREGEGGNNKTAHAHTLNTPGQLTHSRAHAHQSLMLSVSPP